MAVRIELCGRLANAPALRVTPAGTAVLSVVIDCEERAGEMLMPVVVAGDPARILAVQLKAGLAVHARGVLRPASGLNRVGAGRTGVEVVPDEITLADARHRSGAAQSNEGLKEKSRLPCALGRIPCRPGLR